MIEEVLGLKISLGTLSNTEHRVSLKCEKSYEELHEKIQKAELLHIDETGHRLQGKRGWAWVFANDLTTLIKLGQSRGQKCYTTCFLNMMAKLSQTATPPTSYFAEEKRQVCWSHLLRDFERFAQSRDPDLSFIGRELYCTGTEMLSLHRSWKEKKIEQLFFLRRCRILRKRLLYWLKKPYGLPGLEQAKRVSRNIMKVEKMMWLF